jgi:hypothetical protein
MDLLGTRDISLQLTPKRSLNMDHVHSIVDLLQMLQR